MQIQADFWDANILTPTVQANLDKVGGGSIFEDSLELGNAQKWTWDFLKDFKDLRGYDPTTLLPALAGIGPQGTGTPAFELAGVGPQVREDYRQTLSDLYVDRYVKPMQQWARGHGLNFRVQPYGPPIAGAVASAAAGIPEGESLEFGRHLGGVGPEQAYRAIASGAHFSGNNLVSSECCAAVPGQLPLQLGRAPGARDVRPGRRRHAGRRALLQWPARQRLQGVRGWRDPDRLARLRLP